jgi:hypothetical protein
VYGHPKHQEGASVKTSKIENISGSLVTTYKGTIYRLGKPSEGYVEFCENEGYPIPAEGKLDPENLKKKESS